MNAIKRLVESVRGFALQERTLWLARDIRHAVFLWAPRAWRAASPSARKFLAPIRRLGQTFLAGSAQESWQAGTGWRAMIAWSAGLAMSWSIAWAITRFGGLPKNEQLRVIMAAWWFAVLWTAAWSRWAEPWVGERARRRRRKARRLRALKK